VPRHLAAATEYGAERRREMSTGWELNHVGLVVKDKNKALDYYQSLGVGLSVGPQPLLPHIEGETSLLIYRKLDGDPVTRTSSSPRRRAHTFYDAESQIGSLQLEIIQTSPGSFIWEYLESKGEGINHLCFNVPDINTQTDRLLEKGCPLMFNATVGSYIVEDYLDTRKHGDVILSMRPPMGEWERTWKAHNMEEPLVSDWQFRGVGIAVRDLDSTAEYYQSLGITTLQPEVMLDSSSCEDFRAYGKAPDGVARARARMAQVGPLLYEFVQPLEGETIYKECLDKRGEGINNIAFTVDDLEEETARLVENGVAVLLSGKPRTGGAFAYFDTREVGNIMVKLVQA